MQSLKTKLPSLVYKMSPTSCMMSFEWYSYSHPQLELRKRQATAFKIMVSRRSLRNTSLTPPKSINANDFNVAMYENWRLVLKERMMYGFRLRLVAGSWSRGQKSWSRPWTSRWHLQRSASTGTEGWDPGLLDHIDEESDRKFPYLLCCF